MLTRSHAKAKAKAKNKTKAAKKNANKPMIDKRWFANMPALTNASGYVFAPGKYYVGDLSLVLSDTEWGEVCARMKHTYANTCNDCLVASGLLNPKQMKFTLKCGRDVLVVATGNGLLTDSTNGSYTVESGTIGMTLASGLWSDHRGGKVFDWRGAAPGVGLVIGCRNDETRTPVIVFADGLTIGLESTSVPSIRNLFTWGGFKSQRFIVGF
jgi:hypothetical protein